ncbi:hypothetical protein B0I35DRAFT_479837 [Stachybotrys elegans]|uniref:DUF7580 domain-containing protein n=1 Tax=Stachybotrys elegans TaxID=80388 RepID=A0A8K0WQP8_9HYPO|nr:hypothetical protein B0I35DRAFT_479837 [Stachybotrys elegans]
MVTTEPDTLERKALADLQQSVIPWISRLIVRDEKDATCLAALNARRGVAFELDHVFLHQPPDEDEGFEDYDYSEEEPQELLKFLDVFMHEKVLTGQSTDLKTEEQTSSAHQASQPSDTNALPNFKALLRRTLQTLDDPDLSRFINLPCTSKELQEAEEAITRFNTNLTGRYAQRHAGTQAMEGQDMRHQPAPVLLANEVPASAPQEPSWSLVTTLKGSMEAGCCEHQHIARVQVREPTWEREISEGLNHNLFLSCSSAEGKWQQTICRVATSKESIEVDKKHLQNDPRLSR